ncbi:MAG: SH3 domain-containing protein [Bacteroidota bacterium]
MPTFTNKAVLGIDISLWDYEIDVPLLLDAGVRVFIVKMGQGWKNSLGELKPTDRRFHAHCENISRYSHTILMTYFWPEITLSPIEQAKWCIQTLETYRYPIVYTWADAEQYWLDWGLYYKARRGEIPYSLVPIADKNKLSTFYWQFYTALRNKKLCGVYTNKGFTSSWAPNMARWMAQEKVQIWLPYYGKQPSKLTHMSWDEWKKNWYPTYTPPLPTQGELMCTYDNMAGHQCTGDAVVVPGIYQDEHKKPIAADINVFSTEWLSNLLGRTIEPTITSPVAVTIPTGQAYHVNVGLLNIRSGPSSNTKLLGQVAKNAQVIVTSISNEWAQIAYPKQGWVYLQYITKD